MEHLDKLFGFSWSFFLTQFGITYVTIFLRGVQTQNVVGGNYLGAFITSFGMAIANVAFIGLVASDPWASLVPASIGASLGIVSAMYYKRRGTKLWKKPATPRCSLN